MVSNLALHLRWGLMVERPQRRRARSKGKEEVEPGGRDRRALTRIAEVQRQLRLREQTRESGRRRRNHDIIPLSLEYPSMQLFPFLQNITRCYSVRFFSIHSLLKYSFL